MPAASRPGPSGSDIGTLREPGSIGISASRIRRCRSHYGGVSLHDFGIARAAQHAAEARLAAYALAPGVVVRRGSGWFAVRTGVDSNDMNGVVSKERAEIPPELVEDLVAWFRACGASASWLTSRADPQLTQTLLAAGARAERSGYWSGRAMPTLAFSPDAGVEVVRVLSDNDLNDWLDVAAGCGWIETDSDRHARRRLYRALGLGDGALTHWLALEQDQPVGFASSYLDAKVIDLCNLGVVESRRRRGIGRALVAARLVDAARRGATTVVSAPSPDGWRLQQALGFRRVPVVPDTCFYLPI
jgi:GNAT superfamily N-acetyltransferase